MQVERVLIKNWLTQKPPYGGLVMTLLMTLGLFFLGLAYIREWSFFRESMAASYQSVFEAQEYWRLWSTLWAHGDEEHLLNNALLFIPLTYLLSSYYGAWFFPFWGLLFGGLINAVVLQTMPPTVHLIGMSGVVYWMAGAWMSLYFLIDRRRGPRFRFTVVVSLLVMILMPQNYMPQVSYMAHFVGYAFGACAGAVWYQVHKLRFLRAEVYKEVPQFPDEDSLADPSDAQSKNVEELP